MKVPYELSLEFHVNDNAISLHSLKESDINHLFDVIRVFNSD